MLDDIENIDSNNDDTEKIFFGTMYFKVYKEGNFDIYQVIDGQQRLLTIFIVLIVIHNEYEDIFNAKGFTLFNPENNSNKLRFVSRVSDDQEIINSLSNNSTGIHKISNRKSLVYTCYNTISKFFKNKIQNYDDADRRKYFDAFFNKLSRCEIAINELDDCNDMFQVFHSINAQTEKLTIKDILNNYILRFATENEQIECLWNEICLNFKDNLKENFKFEYLLRYFFQYTEKKDVKINDLLQTFCDRCYNTETIYEKVKLFNEFITFVVDLEKNDKYSILLKDKKIILGQLFYCHKEYPDNYDYFKSILFSYLVRRNICEYDTKGITSIIPTLIPNILKLNDGQFKKDGIKLLFKDYSCNNAIFPDNDELKEKILSINFYSKTNICLPILKLIEKYGHHRPKMDFSNLNDATIDHVNSQKSYLNLNDKYSEKERYKINNSIGNLTLLPKSINSSLQDMNFQEKKVYYKNHGTQYAMNSYFITIDTWGVEEIKKRSEVLFEFINDLFPSIF